MKRTTKDNFKRIFNVNYILNKIISYGAYLTVLISVIILTYLSFIDKFNFKVDWMAIGIFSGATVLLSWTCWNTFYHKQYEKLMDEDINQRAKGEYSIHGRYYDASKDWTDKELQNAIDLFNEEYTQKWLNWVEKTTGFTISEIKHKTYRKFKYKRLMWRIKNHKYPKSGYKTSMELLSLFSYQDANFNKRNLRADKHFYFSKSVSKLLISILVIVTGASLVPELIQGAIWAALLRLGIAIFTLFSSIFMGAMTGVRGARIKLSIVEDACADMERWAHKKPIVIPYEIPTVVEQSITEENSTEQLGITSDIFSQLNIPKK